MVLKFIKFCVVGGSGVIVDFGVTYLCKEIAKLNKYVSNSIGFIVAATTNFFLNRFWTFSYQGSGMLRQYAMFFLFSLIGLGLNNSIIYLLHGKGKLNFYLSKLFAIGVVTFWNFFMNYFFNFQ
ncbi:GtrA family protein [Bacteroidales bacterium OttesenSCG-928-B11]|nr:GtrA family protein [Bacteroidales bacterium OttesenSCG-928-B11]MDL2325790.1 GtrA family protein [Bacteroidales bacterium OttesenSCG-928-A14]